MKPWRTLERVPVIRGRWLTVENHTIELPDGQQIRDWQWVIVPDYVNVLVMTPEDEFLVFRQTKYAVDALTLAPVGGMIDAGEDPLGAARRELREELGYEAPVWVPLGKYATDANRGVGVGYLFLAREAVFVAKSASDDLEAQEILRLTRTELRDAYLAGEFKVMSWSATVGLALAYLFSTG